MHRCSVSDKNGNNRVLKHHRLTNIDLISSLRRLNTASSGSRSIEEMLEHSLHEILDIFQCDRAWLLHPCDPKAARFDIKTEATRPE